MRDKAKKKEQFSNRTEELRRQIVRSGKAGAERGQTENELRPEIFFKAFEVNPVGLAMISFPDGRYIEVNRAFRRLTGYTRNETVGRTPTDPSLRDVTESNAGILNLLKDNGTCRNLEFALRRKSGESRTCLFSAELIKMGPETFVISAVLDITGRKRAEEHLQWELGVNTSLASLAHTLISGPLNIDTIADIFLDRSMSLTGSRLGKVSHIDFQNGRLACPAIIRVAEGPGQAKDKETVFKRFSGLWDWAWERQRPLLTNTAADDFRSTGPPDEYVSGERFLSVPLKLGDEFVGQIAVVDSDRDYTNSDLEAITRLAGLYTVAMGHTNFDQALMESEQKYRELADSLPEAVFEIDDRENLVYLNNTGLRIFGMVKEDLQTGVSIFDLLIEKEHNRLNLALSRGSSRESLASLEFIAKRKDKTTFPMVVNSARIIRNGKIVGFRGIAMDMTEAQNAEAERRRIESQLRQARKMEAIGTLAGGIAHDFNNILAAVLGYTELALKDIPQDSRAKERLEQVLKAAYRAKSLVKQILSFSRQTEQKQKPLQIGPLAEEALEFLRASLPTTIEIRQNMETHSGMVLADPTQMHQMLMNLCSNAAHAMRESGGVLEVNLTEVRLDAEAAARSADLGPGVYQKITVSDTGQGMDQETMDRIFEPFFTTKGPGQGTGMGLAVVHGIVKGHGGAMTVWSEPGKGAIFHVFLPLIKGETVDQPLADAGPVSRGAERVLFVDDEEALAALGHDMLEYLGYQVTSLTSSLEALELFRKEPGSFDLMITDQTMPCMTGDELARSILAVRPDIPIILCTGFSEKVTVDEALEIGVKKFLMKPLAVRKVAEVIREVLDSG